MALCWPTCLLSRQHWTELLLGVGVVYCVPTKKTVCLLKLCASSSFLNYSSQMISELWMICQGFVFLFIYVIIVWIRLNGDTWSNAKMQNWHFPPSWEFCWAVLLCRFLLLVFYWTLKLQCRLHIFVHSCLDHPFLYGTVDVVHSQQWQNSIFVCQTYPMTIYAKRLQANKTSMCVTQNITLLACFSNQDSSFDCCSSRPFSLQNLQSWRHKHETDRRTEGKWRMGSTHLYYVSYCTDI